MTTRSNNLPESERPCRLTPHHKVVMTSRWPGYGRQLLSFTLLLSFLNSICLPTHYPQRPQSVGGQMIICAPQNPETLLDYLVGNYLEPVENAPDEEGDSSETVELAKDFLTDDADTPQFRRLFLNHLGYGEFIPQWLCRPLKSFSPPPEPLSSIVSA